MYLTVLTGVNGIVQLITVAVLFIIVLVMTYFTTRFIGNYQKGHLSCTNIQLLRYCASGCLMLQQEANGVNKRKAYLGIHRNSVRIVYRKDNAHGKRSIKGTFDKVS